MHVSLLSLGFICIQDQLRQARAHRQNGADRAGTGLTSGSLGPYAACTPSGGGAPMRSCPRKCDDLRVDEETQRGRARNEAMFRQVNEGIQRGHWPGEEHKPMGFRCECAKIGCNAIVSMSSGTYERIRDHPQWFLLLPGHELDEIETIVEKTADYVVVEKRGEAGRTAVATDPRD